MLNRARELKPGGEQSEAQFKGQGLIHLLAIVLSMSAANSLAAGVTERLATSSSGACRLSVQSIRDGFVGASICSLTQGESTIWSATKPYDFSNPVVSDKGLVAGLAFPSGSFADWVHSHSGTRFPLVILDGTGEELARLDWDVPRSRCGLLVDDENDRLIVRFTGTESQTGDETWYVLRFSTGAIISAFGASCPAPEPGAKLESQGASLIPGTTLFLLRWRISFQNAAGEVQERTRFAVFSQSGQFLAHVDGSTDASFRLTRLPDSSDLMLEFVEDESVARRFKIQPLVGLGGRDWLVSADAAAFGESESNSGGEEQGPACRLEVRCRAEVGDHGSTSIVYSIHNNSRSTISFRRRDLPFVPGESSAILVLRDGVLYGSRGLEERDAGLPMMESLERIVLEPCEAHSERVTPRDVLGNDPEPGAYDVTGIWRPRLEVDGVWRHVSVQIAKFSWRVEGR